MVIDELPEYIEDHETRINEAIEENPDELVFKTTLEPAEENKDSTNGDTS